MWLQVRQSSTKDTPRTDTEADYTYSNGFDDVESRTRYSDSISESIGESINDSLPVSLGSKQYVR